jgi:hypothetical protein
MWLADEWTKDEENRVLALNKEIPGRWAEIARQLGGGAHPRLCAQLYLIMCVRNLRYR